MSNSEKHTSPSSEPSLGDDGRSLWWMIPAAVASVLGVAGAVIARSRRSRPVNFPGYAHDHSENPKIGESAPEITSGTTPPVE